MPISLNDLVANSKYTDDMKIKIGEEELSVADLRSFYRQSDESQKAAEKRRKEAEVEFEKAQRLGADALALYESVKGEKKEPPVTTDGEIDWSEPGMKAVKKKLDEYDAAIKKYDETSKKLESAIASGFAFVTDYVWNQGYNSLDELSRPKDKQLTDLVKYAQEQKITDRWGLPDPVKAARMLTEGDRQKSIEAKAREEGRKEGERAARAAASGARPGTMPPPRRVEPSKGEKPKSMKELLSKAMADPEIQRVAGGLQD